jgi:hypothetical protein
MNFPSIECLQIAERRPRDAFDVRMLTTSDSNVIGGRLPAGGNTAALSTGGSTAGPLPGFDGADHLFHYLRQHMDVGGKA